MPRRTLYVLVLCAMLGLHTASAEVGTAVVFLLLPPGARANGMGQAFVGVADDASAAYYNPGGLAARTEGRGSEDHAGTELLLMHSPWMPVFDLDDLYLDYLAVTRHVPGWGTFALSSNYLHVGEIMETTDQGDSVGWFRVYDIAVNLTYSTQVMHGLGVGGTLKYIRSQLHPDQGVGTNWGLDVGALYQFSGLLDGMRLGVSLSNVGPEISYRSDAASDPMPRLLRVGLSYTPLRHSDIGSLLLALEYNKVMVNWTKDGLADELRESKRCVGLEYRYGKPDEPVGVFLRGGYYYDKEASNIPRGATFGGGVKYKIFQFDFAFIEPPQDLGNTYTKMYSLRVLL